MSRVALSVGFALLFVCTTPHVPSAESSAAWLDRLNFYRTTAALPPVSENPRLSDAVQQHARYMVRHDVIEHTQNRRHPWATADGAAAAAVSNLAASTRSTEPDAWAVDSWMQGPFHALGILDPSLAEVGFGIHRAPDGGIQTAAGLDVIRGRALARARAAYPIVWPANGSTVPLTTHLDEYPSPLTSCPGYAAPAGLPLIVQIGSGDQVPHVMGSRLLDGDAPLEHCIFHEATYRNRDAAEQAVGRRILASRDAIVLVPRRPLRPGGRYRAVIETGVRVIDWTFGVN